jgi:hypothetical protein
MTGMSEGEGVDCNVDDDAVGVVRGGESEEGDGDSDSSGVKGKDGGDRL